MGFVNSLVVDSAYLLDFVGKLSYFGIVEIVYMVQKCLVDDNHHHQMISNLCIRCLLFILISLKKMGNFHYNIVEDVDFLGNLLNWSMYLEDSNSANIRGLGFAYFSGAGVDLFLIDVHNYSCVLQKCFFGMFFVFLTVFSLVYTSDSPYVSIL